MRTKSEILHESLKLEAKTPAWDTCAATNERLTIEVLIDVRDIFLAYYNSGQELMGENGNKL